MIDPLTAALSRMNWVARSKLQGAESAEDQSKATTELREALGEYFDRDMEFRQKELDEVKKGLRTMSDRLQKRAKAKDEIVDLQLQMIVNEAEGLGFFSGSDASNILPGLTGAAQLHPTDAYGSRWEPGMPQPAAPPDGTAPYPRRSQRGDVEDLLRKTVFVCSEAAVPLVAPSRLASRRLP